MECRRGSGVGGAWAPADGLGCSCLAEKAESAMILLMPPVGRRHCKQQRRGCRGGRLVVPRSERELGEAVDERAVVHLLGREVQRGGG